MRLSKRDGLAYIKRVGHYHTAKMRLKKTRTGYRVRLYGTLMGWLRKVDAGWLAETYLGFAVSVSAPFARRSDAKRHMFQERFECPIAPPIRTLVIVSYNVDSIDFIDPRRKEKLPSHE